MKLIYNPDANLEFQYTCEPGLPQYKAAVDAIRNWSKVEELVAFAEARHGYQNTDGMFGITYPTDLDEWDQDTGKLIPDGYVEANAWYGASEGETYRLSQRDYLELLRQYLALSDHHELAERVDSLLADDS